MISITICSQRKRSFPEIKCQHYRGVIQGLNNHASITTQWRIEVHLIEGNLIFCINSPPPPPKKKDEIDKN